MAIDIDKRFSVDAPVERVWAFLTDLERVAGCLEGATVTGRDEEGAWTGTMKVKLGPVSSTYRGKVRIVRTDEVDHVTELSAEGRDTRGKGGADMTMRSELSRVGDATEVRVTSTVHVTGVLARLGRGMVEDVSEQLFGRFTACVKEKLEGAETLEAEEEGVPTGGRPEMSEAGSPTRTSGSGSGPGPSSQTHHGPQIPQDTRIASDATKASAALHASSSEGASSRPAEGSAKREADDALRLGGLGARATGRALERLVRRPAFWVVVVLVVLALWALLGR